MIGRVLQRPSQCPQAKAGRDVDRCQSGDMRSGKWRLYGPNHPSDQAIEHGPVVWTGPPISILRVELQLRDGCPVRDWKHLIEGH